MASRFNLNEPWNLNEEESEEGPQVNPTTRQPYYGDNNLPFDLNEEPPPPTPPPQFAHQQPQHPHHEPSRRLSREKKMEILHFLLSKTTIGRLPVGTIAETAQRYEVSIRTVSRI